MKKLLLLTLAAVVLCGAGSANAKKTRSTKVRTTHTTRAAKPIDQRKYRAKAMSDKEYLKQGIAELNKNLPIGSPDNNVFQSASYVNNVVTFKCTINDEYGEIAKWKEDIDKFKKLKFMTLATTGETQFIKSAIIRANASLRVEYTGSVSGEKLALTYTTQELREMLRQSKDNKEMRLYSLVETWKLSLPNSIDTYTEWTDIIIEPDNLVYVYTLSSLYNTDDIDYEGLENALKESKGDMMKDIKAQDVVRANTIKAIADTGRGLVYRYFINGRSFDVTITNKELQTLY